MHALQTWNCAGQSSTHILHMLHRATMCTEVTHADDLATAHLQPLQCCLLVFIPSHQLCVLICQPSQRLLGSPAAAALALVRIFQLRCEVTSCAPAVCQVLRQGRLPACCLRELLPQLPVLLLQCRDLQHQLQGPWWSQVQQCQTQQAGATQASEAVWALHEYSMQPRLMDMPHTFAAAVVQTKRMIIK